MNALLSRPYYTSTSAVFRLRQAALFGLFVFLFLLLFEPFQIGTLKKALLPVALGFGLVTFLAMVTLNVAFPSLFRNFYREENWTLGREILQTTLNIFVIGCFNFVFFGLVTTGAVSWLGFFWFQFMTLLVGAFPVTIYFILYEKKSRSKYEREAGTISESLSPAAAAAENAVILSVHGQHNSDKLCFPEDRFYYLEASDNYVDFYYDDVAPQRKTLRMTMKSAEEQLAGASSCFRCHRSYIVNLDKVVRISGNAQGYRLHLPGTGKEIPVSRKYNELIRQRLSVRP